MLTPIPRTYPDSDPAARWTTAIQTLISVLGQDAVLIDSALSGYIDPYNLREAEQRKYSNAIDLKTLDCGIGLGALFTHPHTQYIAGLEDMVASGNLVHMGQWGSRPTSHPTPFRSKFTYSPFIEGFFL
ncbi:uncharacterized protein B0T23DRAFT_426939 [Neurospora hispaniola]|uniref:Uncharacterized protein n=1 Tax=Neurospora hispaniola TaxID=588809 RepID=A0AAJ0IDS6_9PEZI|nr:hypothetical protein B0T23DRAFT_426939 [Neurospora hispaniola]